MGHFVRSWASLTVCALGGLVFSLATLQGAALPTSKLDDLRLQARTLETKGLWAHAADAYSQLIVSAGSSTDVKDFKDRYHLCLRHVHQTRRLRDDTFQQTVLAKPLADALRIYDEVLVKLESRYVEKSKSHAKVLYQHGIVELRYALSDPHFVAKYLAQVPAETVDRFREQLASWSERTIANRAEALEQVQRLAQVAIRQLDLPASVVVLEFACGACNALDEYCLYLTPGQFKEQELLLRSESVGIGAEFELLDDQVVVGQVTPHTAAFMRLNKGDKLTHIDGKSVAKLSLEQIRARLRGPINSVVELTVLPWNEQEPRQLKLERRAFQRSTVEHQRMLDEETGYLKLTGFAKNTPTELSEAVGELLAKGMKVLVLDLRRNSGGAFSVSVEVSQMFLSEGTIVTAQSTFPDLRGEFKANNPNPLGMPLVVLVDGETASAAEVFAGALKENGRAKLVGQPTFGKGTIQRILPLSSVPGGLRITVAKFTGPNQQPFSGKGITPDEVIEPSLTEGDDAQLEHARNLANMLRPKQ